MGVLGKERRRKYVKRVEKRGELGKRSRDLKNQGMGSSRDAGLEI